MPCTDAQPGPDRGNLDANNVVRAAVVALDDQRELWFYTYHLGKRRLAGVRIYASSEKYSGPTKSGFDMTLEQLEALLPMLTRLSREVEEGLVVPPVEFGRIPAGKDSEWIVQVLEGQALSEVFYLDIRKHVTSESYVGFTKKGLRVELDWIDALVANLPALCESLEAWREGRWGLFADDEPAEPSATDHDAPDAVPDEYREFF